MNYRVQIYKGQSPINWEQRRYEIAKDALCAIISNGAMKMPDCGE